MAQAQKVRLPAKERDILETRGVIPVPLVPKIDLTMEQCKARGWEVSIMLNDQGETVAKVYVGVGGAPYRAESEHEGLAVIKAFCAALVATEPVQGSLPLFAQAEDDEDESEHEGDTESWGRTDEAEEDEAEEGEAPESEAPEPESDVPETVKSTETDERVEQWIRGGQNGATETPAVSDREESLYRKHVDQIAAEHATGTPRSLEKLLDRAQELERRLSSPAVRKRNIEDYRAELRAIQDEVERREVGLGGDVFDAGGDELARKQGIVATLQAAGMEIDLVDGEYVEPGIGIHIEEKYVEREYQKALGELTPTTAAAG